MNTAVNVQNAFLNGPFTCKAALRKHAAALQTVERVLVMHGTGEDFLLAHFSIAECMCGPLAQRLVQWMPLLRGFDYAQLCADVGAPRLARWVAAATARPSVASTAGDAATTLADLRAAHPDWFACDAKLAYSVTDGQVEFAQAKV